MVDSGFSAPKLISLYKKNIKKLRPQDLNKICLVRREKLQPPYAPT